MVTWCSKIYSLNFTPALEQSKSSLGQIKGQECVSLSQMSLCVTTCGEFGFNGENRSPLVKHALDRCDVPLVPEDFAFPSSWTNWPYPNRKWLQLTALLTMRGDCLLKIERRLQSTTDLHSQDKRPKTKASFRPIVDYIPYCPTGRILRIFLGPLESRKQSFVAAWPYEPSYNDQVAVYFTIASTSHEWRPIFIRHIACFLIPSDMMNNGHHHTDTGLCSLWETKQNDHDNYTTGNLCITLLSSH